MRSKSIVSIIRRYGLNSKKLNPKNRIKYADAVKGIRGYQNSELEIVDVIDNGTFPAMSRSHICQVPGCGMHIRYEYILRNKDDDTELVAGSTCVWTLLGLSELEIKSFKGLEAAIKEYHSMISWRDNNPDVVDILKRLEMEQFTQFKPFWKEIEDCRLTDEDTEYIRKVNVDRLIFERDEAARINRARKEAALNRVESGKAEYDKVLVGLDSLVARYPKNDFYKSLKTQTENGSRLSYKQIKAVKSGCNKVWYFDKIKGTKNDLWGECEYIVTPIIVAEAKSGNISTTFTEMENIDSSVEVVENIALRNLRELNRVFKESSMLGNRERMAWNIYKVKYDLVD